MKPNSLIRFCILLLCFCAVIGAQVPEAAPNPRQRFPGRKPPTLTIEQATEIARKALTKKGTPLKGRFVSRAECIFDPKDFPHEAAQLGKGPFWHIVLRDPENSDEHYPVAPIRVLVFSEKEVAILAPE